LLAATAFQSIAPWKELTSIPCDTVWPHARIAVRLTTSPIARQRFLIPAVPTQGADPSPAPPRPAILRNCDAASRRNGRMVLTSVSIGALKLECRFTFFLCLVRSWKAFQNINNGKRSVRYAFTMDWLLYAETHLETSKSDPIIKGTRQRPPHETSGLASAEKEQLTQSLPGPFQQIHVRVRAPIVSSCWKLSARRRSAPASHNSLRKG
jgi:hypothetical protein